jgi:hypothetical protein
VTIQLCFKTQNGILQIFTGIECMPWRWGLAYDSS